MAHTIDNTLTASEIITDDISERLPLLAEMPYTLMSQTYKKTIKPLVEGAAIIVGTGGLAYMGNKIKKYYNNRRLLKKLSATDPNKINWDI